MVGRSGPRLGAGMVAAAAIWAVGCGSSTPASLPSPGAEDAGADADGGADLGLGAGDAGAPDVEGGLDLGSADGGLEDAESPAGIDDPTRPGPFAVTRERFEVTTPAGNPLPLDCRIPEAPGARPVVLIGHGFQLPASQYVGYAQRLATHGFVACSVDYRAPLVRVSHVESAADLGFGFDALIARGRDAQDLLFGRIDEDRLGLAGHSLGGKLAFLVASDDSRIDAVLGLDPVDGAGFCPPSRCPDATDRLPLSIPVAVLGETIDAAGSPQACAPADDNFQTFYEASASPALEVEVVGANHMSFLDDPESCGLPCQLCNPASTPHGEVIELAYAYTVAFFRRHLGGELGYDGWLDGAEAEARWVDTGRARLRSR